MSMFGLVEVGRDGVLEEFGEGRVLVDGGFKGGAKVQGCDDTAPFGVFWFEGEFHNFWRHGGSQ